MSKSLGFTKYLPKYVVFDMFQIYTPSKDLLEKQTLRRIFKTKDVLPSEVSDLMNTDKEGKHFYVQIMQVFLTFCSNSLQKQKYILELIF